MLGLVRFVLVANVIAAVIVVGLEMSTGFFGLKFVSDYAFFIVLLLWGTTALFFMYPPLGGIGQSDDKVDTVTDSMVDRRVADEIDDERFSENTAFCIKLLIAGVPAFLVCVLASIAT
ncbi:hypothetical protein HJ179_21120 [Vibrio parahaemolyticus]|uniref:hypothetical protein n=1 Tax=Vibrio parahaemolyticus TaxID=670 RepID=UPI0006AA0560|nr:hypothetical protein [Vibrio parahaemolyticus]KOO13044.1 hypothetical protein AKJ18_19925 [Vibrio xuii]MBE3825733.1 hypothetical protein [Vibrio parahaemolyticus]MBE4327840.1 hypothetical protein [Vibrio parahaemolyticus]MDG3414835.1 hypothetical protein [Vibrio parahaemolyticus]QLE27458.1 hypothetical protein FDP11_18375 [Vibrio parahaemolyticus]